MIAAITMCSLDFDEDYISHFLEYYRQQGIEYFYLLLHSKENVDSFDIEKKYKKDDTEIHYLIGDWNCKIVENFKQKIVDESILSENDWLVHVDIDEQVEVTGSTIKNKILEMENNLENCCLGQLTDRISQDGELKIIDNNSTLSEQFPIVSDVGSRVLKCFTRKTPIVRANIKMLGGNHNVLPEFRDSLKINQEILIVNHYKWNSKVLSKLEERVETHKDKFDHWLESARFLNYWDEQKKL
jgi:hypothetical protein